MNFLESVVAEWYEFSGYFVRSNIKFGRLAHGGWKGEADVLALRPLEGELIHVETSTDAATWAKRKERFRRKFEDAEAHYDEILGYEPISTQRIAVVSFNLSVPNYDFGMGIEIWPIPRLFAEIDESLRGKHPASEAIPEGFPLLRTLQYSALGERWNR